jgi:enoyl-CoA hydratase
MITLEHLPEAVVVRLDHGPVNALDVDLLRAITATMRDLAEGPAVVLTGNDRAFSAGLDLRRLLDGGPEYVAELLPALDEAFLAVFNHPRPVVAAVNGHAIAGGCVLAAASDVRLMSRGAIGLTELAVGVPFPVSVLEIVRFAAGRAAADLALTARTMPPQEALRIGLLHAVPEPAELLDEAVRRASALGRLPAAGYAMTKEQLHRPTLARIAAARAADDARALAMWTDPGTHAAIERFLDALAARRPQ